MLRVPTWNQKRCHESLGLGPAMWPGRGHMALVHERSRLASVTAIESPAAAGQIMPALGAEAAERVGAGWEGLATKRPWFSAGQGPDTFDEGRAVADSQHPADPEDVDQPAPPPRELRAYIAEGWQREAPQRADGEGDVHKLLVDRDPRPALHRRQLVEREPQDHRGVVEHQLPPELARDHLQYALEDEEEDLQLELLLGIDLPNHVEKQRHARERVAEEDDQIASHLRPPLRVVVKLLLVDLALLEQWLRCRARGGAHGHVAVLG
eukprot:scaffold30550_cov66-Phaeocystis_antarctica.AAC.2